jgi:hypothetical protein
MLFTVGSPLSILLTSFCSCLLYWAILPYFATQILLFAVANESSKFLPIFKEAAKSFKGKVILCADSSDLLQSSFLVLSHVLRFNSYPERISSFPFTSLLFLCAFFYKLLMRGLNSCAAFICLCGARQWGSWWTSRQLLWYCWTRDNSNVSCFLSSLFVLWLFFHIGIVYPSLTSISWFVISLCIFYCAEPLSNSDSMVLQVLAYTAGSVTGCH